METKATAPGGTSPSDALAALLAGREKMRERHAQLNDGVSASWTKLGQILGDELGNLEASGEDPRDLGALQSAVDQLHKQCTEVDNQQMAARGQLAEIEAMYQNESLRRRQRRTARLGLFFLLIALTGASAVRVMMAG